MGSLVGKEGILPLSEGLEFRSLRSEDLFFSRVRGRGRGGMDESD